MGTWLCAIALALPTVAQSEAGSIVVSPMFEKAELGAILHESGVTDPGVLSICDAAFSAWLEEFNRNLEEFREKNLANIEHNRRQAAAHDRQDHTPPPYPDVYENWRVQRSSMDQQLLNDIAALLNAASGQKWKILAQRRYRSRALQYVARVGVRRAVDLAEIAESFVDGASEDADDMISAYEAELDAAIDMFVFRFPALNEQTIRNYQSAESIELRHRDFRADRLAAERVRFAVEDVNKRFVVRFSRSLSHDVADAFVEHAFAMFYPQVYATSPVEYVAARLKNERLSFQTMQNVQQHLQVYAPAQRRLRRQIADAWERWDTLATRVVLLDMRSEIEEEGGGDAHLVWTGFPARDAWMRNRQLVHNTCQQIRNSLSQAELDALPADVQLMLSW
ncbi:MAG: hypothetical protein ACR2GY_12360 [Phycisphaerales bacterium]